MPKVVITNAILPAGEQKLADAGFTVDTLRPGQLPSRAEVLQRISGADAIVTALTDHVDDEFLAAAGPQLKIVANVAVGFNNFDLDACRRHRVVATNTPDVLTDATADIAFALLLAVTRRLGEGERLIRSRQPWQWDMFGLLGHSLQHKTLGIVGAGSIGLTMAKRARGFDMDVIYTKRSPLAPEVADALQLRYVTLPELLAQSDMISLHIPYTPQTHHLLGDAQFAAMKPGAYLINSARGAVVDEAAMIRALQSGKLAGAGLDVYEHEPIVPDELIAMDNVVLLPHIGSATVETREVMSVLAADNVIDVVAGRPALTPVNA